MTLSGGSTAFVEPILTESARPIWLATFAATAYSLVRRGVWLRCAR